MHDFLQDSCKGASIVYFNYSYTGERVGRAMIGFDFESNEDRDAFRKRLAGSETVLRDVREVSPEALDRMV